MPSSASVKCAEAAWNYKDSGHCIKITIIFFFSLFWISPPISKILDEKIMWDYTWRPNSAVQSKHALCAFIEHNPYFHYTYNFTSIHSHGKKLYLHMFDIINTVLRSERELIISSFLQDFSKGKGSSFQLFCSAHTAFLLCGGRPRLLTVVLFGSV